MLDTDFFRAVKHDVAPKDNFEYEAYVAKYARSTMVLYSRKTHTPLAALVLKADDPGALSVLTSRPTPPGQNEPYFQGMINMPNQVFEFSIVNLSSDGWINFNILHTPHRVNEVDPGPAYGVNAVNELRPEQSYTIEADQRTNRRMLLKGRTKTQQDGTVVATTVQEVESKGDPKQGLYFYLSVVPDQASKTLCDQFAEGTIWKCATHLIRKVPRPVYIAKGFGGGGGYRGAIGLEAIGLGSRGAIDSFEYGGDIRETASFGGADPSDDFESGLLNGAYRGGRVHESGRAQPEIIRNEMLEGGSGTYPRPQNQMYMSSNQRAEVVEDDSAPRYRSLEFGLGRRGPIPRDSGSRGSRGLRGGPQEELLETCAAPVSRGGGKKKSAGNKSGGLMSRWFGRDGSSGEAPSSSSAQASIMRLSQQSDRVETSAPPPSAAAVEEEESEDAMDTGIFEATDVGQTQAGELGYGQERQVRVGQTNKEYAYEFPSEPTVLCMSIYPGLKFFPLPDLETEVINELTQYIADEGKQLISQLTAIFTSDTCCLDLESPADTIVCQCGHKCLNHKNVTKSGLARCPLCRSLITALVQADGLIL
jgi:hypothetical protein